MKKLIKMFLTLCLAFPLSACSKQEYQYCTTVFSGPFDTIIYYNAYVLSEDEFDEQVTLIKDTFTHLDQLFDKYTSYEGVNNIKTINDNAGIAAVEVDDAIIDMLTTVINKYNKVSNKVNVAMGSVLELWHDAREAANNNDGIGTPPDDEALQEASLHCDINSILIDEENSTVYITDPETSLDVGAVAKGYAVEYVKDLLIEEGVEAFLLSAGGNVASYGERKIESEGNSYLERSKTEFNVGITSPKNGAYTNTGDIVAMVIAENNSIVTSGDYERYFTDEEGNVYCHLIDPSTLYPVTYFRSVSIITEDSFYADFISTAVFLMDYESGRAFVESLDGVEAIWLLNDGTLVATDGLVSGDNFYSLI